MLLRYQLPKGFAHQGTSYIRCFSDRGMSMIGCRTSSVSSVRGLYAQLSHKGAAKLFSFVLSLLHTLGSRWPFGMGGFMEKSKWSGFRSFGPLRRHFQCTRRIGLECIDKGYTWSERRGERKNIWVKFLCFLKKNKSHIRRGCHCVRHVLSKNGFSFERNRIAQGHVSARIPIQTLTWCISTPTSFYPVGMLAAF